MTSKAKKQWNHFPAITIRRKTLSHNQHNIVTFPQTYVMRNIIMVFFFIICQLSFQELLNNAENKFLIINFITMDIVLC